MSARPLTYTRVLALMGALALAPAAVAQTAAPAASGGPLQVSTLQSGVVVAPEVRFTEINGKSTTLAGGYLGWETERRLLIGAAGYLSTNRSDGFETQYGGALARWTFLADKPLSVSAGVLGGFGTATLTRPYGEIFGAPRPTTAATTARFGSRDTRFRFGQTSAITSTTPVRVYDDFLLVEPQVHVVWAVVPWLRIDAGATYRAIGSSDLLERQLRGVAGSLAIRFGK